MAIVLQVFVSWRALPEAWIGLVLGSPVMLAGLLLAAWAVAAAAEVDVEHPSRVVTRGPYAFSRNPMYLGWTLIYVGLALVLELVWPLALLPVVLLLTHVAVLREERDLGRRFGADYRQYRRRVRRYL